MYYDKIIDLDSITLADCENFYNHGNRMIADDGRIIDIVEEEDEV